MYDLVLLTAYGFIHLTWVSNLQELMLESFCDTYSYSFSGHAVFIVSNACIVMWEREIAV